VDALDGRPGVYSARYGGGHGDSAANINKLLKELEGIDHRKARFVAVIAFPTAGSVSFFKGMVEGAIAPEASGRSGFGYDPVFIPKGFRHSFGELPPYIKQSISHRRKAIVSFIEFLKAPGQ
jgi:XTP/dITP diphosphohydrolase